MRQSSGEKPLNEEQRAFAEELFRSNYKLLSKRVYELLRDIDPDSAEDCLGNLFLTLCLCADKVMAHENPTAWLFLTAKFICLKHIRAVGAASKRTVPLDDELSATLSEEGSLENSVIEDVLWCQWKNEGMRERLLSELNENEREILKLRFEKGLSNRQIGEMLDKSEDAVRFTVYYVKKKLTKRIYEL